MTPPAEGAAMPAAVFCLVLMAAALHAGWNAILKGAGDKRLSTVLVTASAGAVSAAALPFLAQPAAASWPFIAASVLLHLAYFVLVMGAYHAGDMSRTYPLMRGTAPMLVAAASLPLFGEALAPAAWSGIVLVTGGVFALLLPLRTGAGHGGTVHALLNAVVIAAYTIVDGMGARQSGAPAAYTLWMFFLTALPFCAWALRGPRGKAALPYLRRHLRLGLTGGLGSVLSYAMALWAMTLAPVAMVAALRETSILFATVLAAFVLKEPVGPARAVAAGTIAVGAMVLRLA